MKFVLLVIVVLSVALVGSTADALRVAAGQLQSQSAATPSATIALNVATLNNLIEEAVAQNASLVTFPEFALNGVFDFHMYSSAWQPGPN